MPVPLFLKLSAAIIFSIQFLIFAYLYSSHRVPFFRYLVWAWGLLVVAKVSTLCVALVPEASGSVLAFVADFDGVLADLSVVSAALAFGWGYRLRWPHALGGALYASLLALLLRVPATASALETPIRVLGGLTLMAAGVAFWVARYRTRSCRAARFLAGSLGLWGAYRAIFPFLTLEPGTEAHIASHMLFMLFYFLSVFAIIIMVLDRARREMAALVGVQRDARRRARARACSWSTATSPSSTRTAGCSTSSARWPADAATRCSRPTGVQCPGLSDGRPPRDRGAGAPRGRRPGRPSLSR